MLLQKEKPGARARRSGIGDDGRNVGGVKEK
jgi:hypothetical protein